MTFGQPWQKILIGHFNGVSNFHNTAEAHIKMDAYKVTQINSVAFWTKAKLLCGGSDLKGGCPSI